MQILSTIGYWFAALIVATFPAAILYWLIIHPFAGFWRRLGKATSFSVVGAICIAVSVLIGLQHGQLLAVHWGYHWALIAAGLVLYGIGIYGERLIRRHLKYGILAGAPELDADKPGHLLTDGIYAHSRNPRYVNLIVALLGWALILNYPALYVVTAICVPMLYLIVLLEERELRQRFGEPYEAYCRQVPRFFPRFRKAS